MDACWSEAIGAPNPGRRAGFWVARATIHSGFFGSRLADLARSGRRHRL